MAKPGERHSVITNLGIERMMSRASKAYKEDGTSIEVKGHMCQMKEFRFYYGECGRPMGRIIKRRT